MKGGAESKPATPSWLPRVGVTAPQGLPSVAAAESEFAMLQQWVWGQLQGLQFQAVYDHIAVPRVSDNPMRRFKITPHLALLSAHAY